MDLEIIILSEASQKEKDKTINTTHTRNLKNNKLVSITKVKQTHRENKPVVTVGTGKVGGAIQG